MVTTFLLVTPVPIDAYAVWAYENIATINLFNDKISLEDWIDDIVIQKN